MEEENQWAKGWEELLKVITDGYDVSDARETMTWLKYEKRREEAEREAMSELITKHLAETMPQLANVRVTLRLWKE